MTDSTILSRRDVEFLLFEWLDVGALTKRERFREHSEDTFRAVLQLSERIATEHFAPHNRRGDLEEPCLVEGEVRILPDIEKALQRYAEAGLAGSTMDAEVGGMQLPQSVFNACTAWFYAANMSTAAYNLLTVGTANLLLAHGTPEQIKTYVVPMLEGRYFGTMALSEEQAGSSLADITTKALPQDDDTYRLFGNKMWISGADHHMGDNIINLVLAKVPGGGPGVKGISLFIVPKYLINDDGSLGEHNDIAIAGLNHKMGARGTVNTVPVFGDGTHSPSGRAGAIGYLVGQEHRGLTYMFHMMNEARVGVGLSATALGYTGFLKSVSYAKNRPQGRPAGTKDPDAPQVALVEHPDVRRMLLTQKSYVEGALALNLYCGHLLDEQRTDPDGATGQRAKGLLDLLTPLAKSWPSQWCLAANDLAIQVHGGYGYTRDYDVEQHYRDNRLNAIHEGTNGIQALDFTNRKVVADSGSGLRTFAAIVDNTIARAAADGDELLSEGAECLDHAWHQLIDTTQALLNCADAITVSALATPFTEAAGHLVIGWVWLEQVLAAHGRPGPFYDGKRSAARYFFRWEVPRALAQLRLVADLDDTFAVTDPRRL